MDNGKKASLRDLCVTLRLHPRLLAYLAFLANLRCASRWLIKVERLRDVRERRGTLRTDDINDDPPLSPTTIRWPGSINLSVYTPLSSVQSGGSLVGHRRHRYALYATPRLASPPFFVFPLLTLCARAKFSCTLGLRLHPLRLLLLVSQC